MPIRRFETYSRGALESRGLSRKERLWGKRPKSYPVLLGLILVIGGVIGGFKFWSDNGVVDDERRDIVSPLPVGEAMAGVGGSLQGTSRECDDSCQLQEEKQKEEKERTKLYLRGRGSPLADLVEFIYQEEEAAEIQNLSRLVISIAGAESNFGKASRFNNLWGIKCGHTTYCHYSSLEEGIQAICDLLQSSLYGLGGRVSEEDIWRIAPTYAESPRWPHNVSYFWNELKG